MRVRWEQIDPRVAARVGAYVSSAGAPAEAYKERPEPSAAPPRNVDAATQAALRAAALGDASIGTVVVVHHGHGDGGPRLEAGWSVVAFCVALLVVALYFTVCFHLAGPALTLLLTTLPVGIVGLCAAPGMTAAAGSRRPRGPLVADARLRGAFAEASSTRAERLYGDVVLTLAEAPPVRRRRERRTPLRRELLRQCNELLADHFRIEAQRRRVQQLIDRGRTLGEAEGERRELAARIAAEADPVARRALEEGLDLCEERVDSVRSLQTLLARLDAHDEVICQALSLARAALTRAEASRVALETPDVSGLRRTVRLVTAETRAVEEAVAELAER